MVSFTLVSDDTRRAVAVVGTTVMAAIGAPAAGTASLSFDVVDQPEGSDLFESGSDLGFADLADAVFAFSGVYRIEATTANGEVVQLTILVWPAEVLEVDELKYLDRPLRAQPVAFREGERPPLTNAPRERQLLGRMNILRSLAQHCSLEAAATTLENSPGAPYFGADSSLGIQGSLAAYGAAYA